jgi:molybdopterin synthase catalytic subunit
VNPGPIEGMRRRAVRVLVPCLLGGHAPECTDETSPMDRGPTGPERRSSGVLRVRLGARSESVPTMNGVAMPPDGADWIELLATPLPTEDAVTWATTPTSGAVVSFLGVVRDSSEGRSGVVGLGYEAYEAEAVRVLGEIAAEARLRWPDVARIALLHRTGELAFEAARYCIDTLKESAPIWKREHWSEGSDWAHAEQPIRPVGASGPSRA